MKTKIRTDLVRKNISLILLASIFLSGIGFTPTQAKPAALGDGPGGPVLILINPSFGFGRYLGEILLAEGLNEYKIVDISAADATLLNAYDVVLLARMPLSDAQAAMLTDWVTAGGNLIAMRPDARLASLLGIAPAAGTLSNAYLLVDTASGPGVGTVNTTIQYHGTADRYTLNGAAAVATLYSDAVTATSNPAVTLISVGSNGGQAAAFTYDLARSVVYTRQGNPAWEGMERDGSPPIRTNDLFYGNAAGDPQPDWVDLNKAAIPQADEQQRLLVKMIESMNLDKKPLPRFWYFPRGEKAVVLLTGDDHGSNNVIGRLDHYIALSPAGCSAADWECVRTSAYIYDATTLSEAQALGYTAQGFEIGVHLNLNCMDYTPASLLDAYTTQLAQFTTRFPSLPAQDSERTHCITWSDWASQPTIKEQKGIRLDTNYFFWPPTWVNDHPAMFTGSGMPMRFADVNGSIFDVYQAATQMTDESEQTYPYTVDTLLDRALGAEGYYGVFTANMHTTDPNSVSADAIVASAQARGVPVVSGRQLLTWLDGRGNSTFSALDWQSGSLTFHLSAAAGSNGLRAMLPIQIPSGVLIGLTRGALPVSYDTTLIKGKYYAFYDGLTGDYQASYTSDTSAPVISNVHVTANPDQTAVITWDTNELASSRIDYGKSAGSLNLNSSSPALVTSHSMTLSALAPNTIYHLRITSADLSNNTAVFPEPPAAPLSFKTPAKPITQIQVHIGGSLRGSYDLPPSGQARVNYTGVDNGPVVVASTDETTIIAAMRDAWTPTGGSSITSFAQVMGLPAMQLSDTYYFPAYNNVNLDEQLRFGNVGGSQTTVTVTIGGTVRGTYVLQPNEQKRVNYPGLDSGPVVVSSSAGVKIIAAMRDAWTPTGGNSITSFVQTMGLPAGQLSTSYYFPAYNNVNLDEQLRFGNVGLTDTTVTVTIGGVVRGSYILQPNEQKRVNYAGLDSGPVIVSSSGGVKIIAAIRDAWTPPGGYAITSFSQLMGLPAGALSTAYVFPAYNNVNLDEQLRFGNVGGGDTTVTVTIGGIVRGTYLLHPNEQKRVNYAGLDSGPVVVESSGGVPIIAAIRDAWTPTGGTSITSFIQLMGLPSGLLSDTYYFPSYNNVTLNEQLRFGVP